MGPSGRLLVSWAPGRVNLVGDHTDYNDGLALPMAIDLGTEVQLTESDAGYVLLFSTLDPSPVRVPLDIALEPRTLGGISPAWARLAAAVAAQARPPSGGVGRVTTTVPVGAGLSSSAAFCVALAAAFGVEGSATAMAHLCQRAEAAVGADVGLMDPLVSARGRDGFALLIDFSTLGVEEVPVPPDAEVVVVHSGEGRRLGSTPYGARRAECEAASVELGIPLGRAEAGDLAALADPVLRGRARHVVTECRRVRELADALRAGDLAGAGAVMVESQHSLAGDFAASTPGVDALVEAVLAMDGVHGARMTGGGFGGCVVALTDPGALDPGTWPGRAWRVRPSDGASLRVIGSPHPSVAPTPGSSRVGDPGSSLTA
jgi:galactokinase